MSLLSCVIISKNQPNNQAKKSKDKCLILEKALMILLPTNQYEYFNNSFLKGFLFLATKLARLTF